MLARLNRPAAILFVVLLAALSVWCLTMRPPPIKTAKKGGYTDVALYHDTAKAVASGVPYHQAATQMQRMHNYPTKPFMTVRPPVLVETAAWIGWAGVQKICMGLLLIGVFAWTVCLEGQAHWIEQGFIAGVVGAGGAGVLREGLMALHEYPAGLCLAIGLAAMIGAPRKWWLAALPIVLGLAIRELVLPFVLLALAFSAFERRWNEVLGWAGVLALFGAYMAWHAHEVSLYVKPSDITSQGWHAMQGFSGFLKAVIFTSLLQGMIAQTSLGFALWMAMLPLVGWCALGGRGGLFALLLTLGYAVMISAFSRADTFYWGAIVLPWYFAGYALLPRAMVQLWGAIAAPRSALTA